MIETDAFWKPINQHHTFVGKAPFFTEWQHFMRGVQLPSAVNEQVVARSIKWLQASKEKYKHSQLFAYFCF